MHSHMHHGRLNNLFSRAAQQLLDLLTLGLWSKLGKLVHYGVDAILSTCTAFLFHSLPQTDPPRAYIYLQLTTTS